MNKARSKKARGNMCNWLFCLFVNVQVFVYIVLALAISQPVHAAVFNCSSGDVDALIEAINTANSRDGDDIINLEPGTYILTQKMSEWSGANGLPLITSNITIIGSSNLDDTIINVSENGYGDMRVFTICRGATVSLQGLSITGGGPDSGGAIRNDATLFITDCVISGNVAKDGSGGGIYNARGTLIMNECIVSHNSADEGNGGGIYSSGGKVMITNSSICGNSMSEDHGGGGIYIEENGILIIDSSTICYNVAKLGAGGGGILADHGSVIITNSTIANNHASRGGGIQNEGSSVSITNTTISGNEARTAGGINNAGRGILEIRNTILAGNFGGHNPDCFGHPITSLGNNLIGNVSVQCDIDLLASDIIGYPGLCEFTDDGKPGNGHFELQSSSRAIDAGNNSTCVNELAFDQLGFPRVDGDDNKIIDCDIGAVEFQRPNIYRFVVMADSRDDNGTGVNEIVFPKVMASISELSPQPTFILFVGDLVTGREDGSEMTRQFQEWKEYVTQYYYPLANIYPVFGGHERNSSDSDEYPRKWSAFQKAFDPINEGLIHSVGEYFEPEGRGNTVYYFEYQNAGFFVLNNDCNPSNDPSECDFEHEIDPDQLEWLKTTKLAVNEQPLKFFFHHEPAFGTGAHKNDPPSDWLPLTMDRKKNARDNYIKILAEYDATMIFTGHEHQYVRRLINQALTDPPYESSWGSFYEVKTGTCGAPIKDVYHDKFMKNVVVVPVYEYHYAVVDVYGTDVSVNVYAVDESTGNRKRTDSFRHPQPIPPSLPIEPRTQPEQPENWRFWPGKDDVWRYFKGEETPPVDWKSISFDV